MKQLSFGLGVILLTALLTACGDDRKVQTPSLSGPSEPTTSSEPPPPPPPPPPPTFAIGGTVSGLGEATGLQLNDGIDTITIGAGESTFSFQTRLESGTPYVISIATQPAGKTCTVAGGSGTIDSADVANAVVTCADQAFQLGGTIQGLSDAGLVLANGEATIIVDADSTTFRMPAPVAFGSSYSVTVQAQPVGLACTVTNGSGVMPASDFAGVSITCTDRSFSLGGSITGLGNFPGLVLANGPDTLSVKGGATGFTMSAAVSYGSAYSVTVEHSPDGLTCSVTQGSGSMPANNVTDVAVTCADQAYSVGGTISGLTVPGLVLTNGSDTLAIPANAKNFTMPTSVAFTSSYSVSIATQPTDFHCSVSNGAGTIGAGPVTNVTVTCAQTAFTLGGTISGLTAGGLVLSNGSDTLKVLPNAETFTMPTPVTTGASYNVTVVSSPAAVHCTASSASGVVGNVPLPAVSISCEAATLSTLYSFGDRADSTVPSLPAGNLIQGKDGSYYGTTGLGGTYKFGTVFRVTPSGEMTVVWSFGAGSDGKGPDGSGVIRGRDGDFYGVTVGGGQYGAGTAFKVTPSGSETVLWSFGGSITAGRTPQGGLLEASDGNFYGVTVQGGAEQGGTLYRLTPSGAGTEMLSFSSANGGGMGPASSGLTQNIDGKLYGTTSGGGAAGEGTVFSMTLDGDYETVWSFDRSSRTSDALLPVGSLLNVGDGTLLGVSEEGGSTNNGAIFRVLPPPTASVTNYHSFQDGADDGARPVGSLIKANDGNFYGVTSQGGDYGNGVIYRVSSSEGELTVLYSLPAPPSGGLVQGADGSLYGLTVSGGANGGGSVYQVK